jgi:hypothetical protein
MAAAQLMEATRRREARDPEEGMREAVRCATRGRALALKVKK